MLIIKTKIYKSELSDNTASFWMSSPGEYLLLSKLRQRNVYTLLFFTMCQVMFFSQSCYEGQASLELSKSSCLCLLSAQVTGMCSLPCLTPVTLLLIPVTPHPFSPMPRPCLSHHTPALTLPHHAFNDFYSSLALRAVDKVCWHTCNLSIQEAGQEDPNLKIKD